MGKNLQTLQVCFFIYFKVINNKSVPEVSIIQFYHDNIKFYSTTSRRLKSENLNGYIPLQNKFKMKT